MVWLVFLLKARRTDVETLLWLETIRLFILRRIRKDATERERQAEAVLLLPRQHPLRSFANGANYRPRIDSISSSCSHVRQMSEFESDQLPGTGYNIGTLMAVKLKN